MYQPLQADTDRSSARRLALQLEMLVAQTPPATFESGSMDVYGGEVASLASYYQHLTRLYAAFVNTLGALHPRTYSAERWQAMQTAASHLAAELRLFPQLPRILFAVNSPADYLFEPFETYIMLGGWEIVHCRDVPGLQALSLPPASVRYVIVGGDGLLTRNDIDPYLGPENVVAVYGQYRGTLGFA